MKETFCSTCRLEKKCEISGFHTAFIRQMKPCDSSQGEYHNFWEMVIVFEGELCITTDEKTYAVSKNQAYLHPPMEYHRHSNQTERDNEFAVLTFDAGIADPPAGIMDLSPRQAQCIRQLIREMREIHEVEGHIRIVRVKPQRELLQQELVLRLEMFMIDVLNQKERHESSSVYTKIAELLSGKVEDNISLDILAQALYMSPSNVKRVFSQFHQGGIMRFYHRMQMDKAVSLMREGYSVRETSEKMNFPSQSSFCNAFKRVYGVSPTRYLSEKNADRK